MRQRVQNLLAWLSRKIIAKYNPRIIGITGSVGKTSSKEAIFSVVSQKHFTWKSEKNFNSEFGLPYAIIGIKNDPGRSIKAWLGLLFKAFSLAFFKQKYPEVLVLEMGVDHPGDMDYLLSIAHPNISVITNISFAHHVFFKDVEAIETEKGKIAQSLRSDEYLVVNGDNEKALSQINKTSAKAISYSTKVGAEVFMSKVQEDIGEKPSTQVEINTPTKKIYAQIKAIGDTHLLAVLSAVSVAEILKIEADLIATGIEQYKPQGGRLNIISGVKHSVIIDDSYNASPAAVEQALGLLARMPQSLKIAVLGDMLDLGSISDGKHEELGQLAGGMSLAHLITVGPSGKIIAEGAKSAGMLPDKILSFDNSEEAKKVVKDLIDQNTAILIKGSQGMRMEKITKEIMADPARAQELLCRQYGKWLKN